MTSVAPLITEDPAVYARAAAALPMRHLPAARAVLLIDPTGFSVSAESALDNPYMASQGRVDLERAWSQFRELRALIGRVGRATIVFPGMLGYEDGVFSNNVFGFAPRRLVVGSMKHPVRQQEARRTDVRTLFHDGFGYDIIDLSGGPVAELTGVLVIDRLRRVGVCGLGPRVDPAAIEPLSRAFGLHATLVTPIREGEYHLNIVLALLAGRAAVLWDEAFLNPDVPKMISALYDGRVLHLTEEEKNLFAGNCLALTQRDMLMSATAVRALRPRAIDTIASWGFQLHAIDVSEFEKAGGSLRCLLTEVY